MKTLLLIALVLFGIAIGYPRVNEETTNVCSALESRLITILSAREHDRPAAVFLGALQSVLPNGSLARSMVKLRSPDAPPVLTCGFAYWQLVLDRGRAESMITELVAGGKVGGRTVDDAAKALSTEAAGELLRTVDPKAAA